MTVPASLLNEAQYRAVTHGCGPLLVLAGAGTGKTRVLVHRLAFLLEQGVLPDSILLLTFTRRAAQEMLRRAAEISGKSFAKVQGGTFHAVGSNILRRHGRQIGIEPNFTVIDRNDVEDIIRQVKPSCRTKSQLPDVRQILNVLSAAINKSLPVAEAAVQKYPHFFEFVEFFVQVSSAYARYKAAANLMDYDDLLVCWHRLFTESPYAAEKLSGQFQHVLVDEYQDVNRLQAEIVRLLTSYHGNVTAVGDEAQGIYSFRGAEADNILRFQEAFPRASEVRLEQNYRSLPPVLCFANAVIDKRLFSTFPGGSLPVVHLAMTEGDEAHYVLSRIRELLASGISASEIAVLFRTAHCSIPLELELLAEGIPYQKRGGLKLTESAHGKDVLSYFRVLVNPHDRLSWSRILQQIDKVGPKTSAQVVDFLLRHDSPLEALKFFHPAPAWQSSHFRLIDLFKQFSGSPAEVFDHVMAYYEPVLFRKYPDSAERARRYAALDQLRDFAVSSPGLRAFVEDTALEPPDSGSAAQSDSLILSTVHSAKGLEFKAVFVIGLVETRFPCRCFNTAQREEERRLFYVAVTRAREQLFLTWPARIMNPDRTRCAAVMSSFLRDISPALYRTDYEFA